MNHPLSHPWPTIYQHGRQVVRPMSGTAASGCGTSGIACTILWRMPCVPCHVQPVSTIAAMNQMVDHQSSSSLGSISSRHISSKIDLGNHYNWIRVSNVSHQPTSESRGNCKRKYGAEGTHLSERKHGAFIQHSGGRNGVRRLVPLFVSTYLGRLWTLYLHTTWQCRAFDDVFVLETMQKLGKMQMFPLGEGSCSNVCWSLDLAFAKHPTIQ